MGHIYSGKETVTMVKFPTRDVSHRICLVAPSVQGDISSRDFPQYLCGRMYEFQLISLWKEVYRTPPGIFFESTLEVMVGFCSMYEPVKVEEEGIIRGTEFTTRKRRGGLLVILAELKISKIEVYQ